MNEFNPLQTLHRHTSQLRSISISISIFSFLFLALMLFISQQRTQDPALMSLHYIGVVIALVQIPLSFYIWKYIAQRMPLRYNEYNSKRIPHDNDNSVAALSGCGSFRGICSGHNRICVPVGDYRWYRTRFDALSLAGREAVS